MPDSVSSSAVRFDVFEVDLRAGELRKRGQRVRLQEQPFRVLSLLLQRAGNLVTRDELRQSLWPADTFVDFDHGLNSAVARLREALSDSPDKPRFIENVAKRGYRFISPLAIDAPFLPQVALAPVMEKATVVLTPPFSSTTLQPTRLFRSGRWTKNLVGG